MKVNKLNRVDGDTIETNIHMIPLPSETKQAACSRKTIGQL